MMKRAFSIFGLAVLLLMGLADQPPAGAQARPRVVSSFSIVGELVARVGGDRIEHRVLVGANTDTHTYEPTPQDTAALTAATVVFQNGLGFEPWLDRLYRASGSRAEQINLAQGIPTLVLPGDADATGHSDADGHGHQPGELDPHVWHDVSNVIQMAAEVRDSLTAIDPDGGSIYRANAEQYIRELETLDIWIQQQVAMVAPERRKLVTSHDTFAYFARRYGFEIVGTALGSVSTEVADPSAGAVVGLINEIRAAGVTTIFAENVSNPRLMEQIASAAGVRLVDDLSTDALGERDTPSATYDGLMRHNVTRIVEALRP
ncbi:MAG: metal ABC transporter substrate-binding protein [Chloroflexota bacterium]